MNTKDKKKLICIMMGILIFIFVYIVISVLTSALKGKRNSSLNDDLTESDNRYSYNFSNTLNLEESVSKDEPESMLYTDRPYFGTVTDYDDAEIRYEGGTIVLETQLGYMTIALNWMEEGLATKVKEPDFGDIKKFFLNADGSINVTYENVKMEDVTGYIKELYDLGFDHVTNDKKNKKRDSYYYAAKNKDGIAINLSYEKGIFLMGVFN